MISSNADFESFNSTFQQINDPTSLYGKDFAFEILKVTTEVPGTISYVNVKIVLEGQPLVYYFTLLKDRSSGVWLLVNHEVARAMINTRQE